MDRTKRDDGSVREAYFDIWFVRRSFAERDAERRMLVESVQGKATI